MSPAAKAFLQRWFVTTLGVLAAAGIVDGVHAEGTISLLSASLFLGVLNAFIRPVLLIVALPLLVVTLGLFTFVINALLLYFVATLVKGFYVADFWSALWGAILISIVSVIANMMLGKPAQERPPPPPRAPRGPRPPAPPNTGSGPIIDV